MLDVLIAIQGIGAAATVPSAVRSYTIGSRFAPPLNYRLCDADWYRRPRVPSIFDAN